MQTANRIIPHGVSISELGKAPTSLCLFATARQILARLRETGETLETVSGKIQSEPCGGQGCDKSAVEPDLQTLLEQAAQLAEQLFSTANGLAIKVGQ